MEFFKTKRKQKAFQLLAVGLLCVVLLVTGLGCSTKSSYKSGIVHYDKYLSKVCYSERFMPALHDVGTYENAEVFYQHTEGFFILLDSVNLILTYTPQNYEAQKAFIDQNYGFTDVMIYREHQHGIYCEEACDEAEDLVFQDEIEHKGFRIRTVSENLRNSDYVYTESVFRYYFGLIGFDDATNRICYLFAYDYEADYMDTVKDMARFVERGFCFELQE